MKLQGKLIQTLAKRPVGVPADTNAFEKELNV
jgi:hypothetical protein